MASICTSQGSGPTETGAQSMGGTEGAKQQSKTLDVDPTRDTMHFPTSFVSRNEGSMVQTCRNIKVQVDDVATN